MRFNPHASIITVPVEASGPAGEATLDLVLDTGASYVTVATRLLESIGYDVEDPDRVIDITTASGIETVPVVTLASLTALGVSVPEVDAVCHDVPPGSGVEGLLGLSFLRHLDLDLHLRSGRIEAVGP